MSKPKFSKAESLFRKLLRDLRLDKNLTQTQVAERLGRPQSYVSKYEAGERRLDFVETFFVCKVLEITIEAFARAFIAEVNNTENSKRG